jgi:hypothetical protein
MNGGMSAFKADMARTLSVIQRNLLRWRLSVAHTEFAQDLRNGYGRPADYRVGAGAVGLTMAQ